MWLWLGVIAGVGLENKISMLFMCFGVVVGLLLSDQRRRLLSPWLWAGGAIAVALFLPYVIWNVNHGMPTLEFMRNAQELKNYHASILGFFGAQVLLLNPLAAPIWLAGVAWCLFAAEGRRYRVFGWTYLVVFTLLALQGAKAYYAAPAYVLMFAAGAVAFERSAEAYEWGGALRRATAIALIVAGLVCAPLAIPALPPATLAQYSKLFGMSPAQRSAVMGERNEQGALPQNFADRFGWRELTAAVAHAYASVPPGERARMTILASNYGEAGALDFFGPQYDLPPAISGHNSYWFWGYRDPAIDSAIVIGAPRARLEQVFEQVVPAGEFECHYCMEWENHREIYICRGLKTPIAKLWPMLKHFI
jgi:hypothetical protein